MKYNFDKIINRKNTNSLKHDFFKEYGKPEDILPMWVADMDFETAPCIIEKIKEKAEIGIYGYTDVKEDYFDTIASWYGKYHNWKVKRRWLVQTPSVIFAMSTAIRAYTKEGEGVLIQQPVYYPFANIVMNNHRKLINNPLVLKDGHYEINFEEFEQKIIKEDVKLFLLCSPHNPVGRVWREWELRRIGEICLKHKVLVLSDEIHSEFIRKDYQHMVFANLDPRFADITITCTSPSKTFNLAGLQVANIFISNLERKREFVKVMKEVGYRELNLFGISACQAAYEGGRDWLEHLQEYLEGNLTFVKEFLKANLPEITLIEPEGTYLIWLDFRKLNLTEEEREKLIVEKGKLWLDSGVMFGIEGDGFERINIACPRSILEEAMKKLVRAIQL